MLFVSRHAEHNVLVRTELVEWVRGRNNEMRRLVKAQPVYAQFQNHWWMLTDPQKIQALSVFEKNGKYIRSVALGDIMEKMTITEDGPAAATMADRPEIHYGVFNTEEAWKLYDPDTRAELEAELMESTEFGVSFIHVDDLPSILPWPTYDDFNDPAEIAALTRVGGFDPALVVVYEKSHKNRPEVLAAIEASLVAEVEKEAEDASLSTTA